MYQHKNFVKQAGSSHWNKLELTCLPPAGMTVTQLMSTRPHMQEARERFKKIGEGHFVWCVVFLQCSEMKVTVFRFSNLSSEIHKYRPSSSYHAVPAGRRNKMLERTLATLNASSPIMSHAFVKTQAARTGVICQGASSAPVQLSICVPISLSRIHLTASLYLCPADCFQDILFEQAGNSHWKELAFLQHIK